MTEPKNLYVVISGPVFSGKATFIKTIAEGFDTYYSAHLSEIPLAIDSTLSLVLHYMGGARRFDLVTPFLCNESLGVIILVDSTHCASFKESCSLWHTFRAYCSLPSIIVANKHDSDDAWPIWALRIALQIPEEVPLIPCIATDLESVKNVLLALCDEALKWLDNEESED